MVIKELISLDRAADKKNVMSDPRLTWSSQHQCLCNNALTLPPDISLISLHPALPTWCGQVIAKYLAGKVS